MSKIDKPSKEELHYWDNLLNPGRNTIDVKAKIYFKNDLRDDTAPNTTAGEVPAQPVRNGGLLWRERIFVHDRRQDRNRRPRYIHVCKACEKNFEGTKRAVYCSTRCRVREYDRRRAAKHSYGKLTILSEGSTK